jgi:hypothetical protein
MVESSLLVRHYLLYFILPLWLLAGLTDYILHRQTRIEDNAGTKESLLHAVQLGEVGIPVLLGLLLDINALLILLMLIALVVHEFTAFWDVTYAHTKRYISPLEQHVHSFMEILPIMAISFVTVMYWDQFLALFGLGVQPARFELRLKPDPISTLYLVALFFSILVFILFPYGEELWRCLRAARQRRSVEPRITRAA